MATTTTDRSESTTSRIDPWRIVWQTLAGDAMLAAILLVIASLLALAAGLPQSPDSAADPVAFSRWRSQVQARWGNAFAPLHEIGLFSLSASPVLHSLIALSALCLLVRATDSSLSLWRARRPGAPPDSTDQVLAPFTLQDMAATLRKKYLRVVHTGDGLYADRFPLANLAPLAIYVGGLIVIASLALASLAGWRTSNLTLGVGQMLPIHAQRGSPRPTSVRLDALDADHHGQVAVLRETELIGTGSVGLERSIELAGLTILLDQVGPAVRASAALTDGQVVPLQAAAAAAPSPELLLLLTQEEPDRFFAAPKADLVVRLARGVNVPDSIRVQIYRSHTGAVLFDDTLPASGQLNVENANLRLSLESYAVLSAAYDPSRWPTVAGMTLMALGLILTVLIPARQLWAASNENGTRLEGDRAALRAIVPTLIGAANQPGHRWTAVSLIGWKIGFALLCGLAGTAVIWSLMRGQPTWTQGPATCAILAAWLAGCAAMAWPRRAIRWLALAILVAALAAVISPTGSGLARGL